MNPIFSKSKTDLTNLLDDRKPGRSLPFFRSLESKIKSENDFIVYRQEIGDAPDKVNLDKARRTSPAYGNFTRLYFHLAGLLNENNRSNPLPPLGNIPVGYRDEELTCVELMKSDLRNVKFKFTELRAKYPNKTLLPNEYADALLNTNKLSSEFNISYTSQSETWVALCPPGSKDGELAKLTITLFRIDDEKLYRKADELKHKRFPHLTLALYPSLNTSFEWFSEFHDGYDDNKKNGWWTTLDNARDWALEYFHDAVINDPTSGGECPKGHYIARWDLARGQAGEFQESQHSKSSATNGKNIEEVSGPSHGAAFAPCLAQALARAHLETSARRAMSGG